MKTWTVAFAAGVVCFIAAAVSFHGIAPITAASAAIAAAIAVLNGLLSPRQIEPGQNWIVAKARDTLLVTPFLKGATIVVWLGCFTIVGVHFFAAAQEARQVRRRAPCRPP